MKPSIKAAKSGTESGVTMIEMLIAITVLSIGLVALAQLFVVAAYNNSFAIATSGGVSDAQRLIEDWKVRATTTGINNAAITSSTWDSGTGTSAAFANLTGYNSANSLYQENVWVFDKDGNLVGTATPSLPPGITAGQLRSVGNNSRLVYILMTPKTPDPRLMQPVTLAAIITGD